MSGVVKVVPAEFLFENKKIQTAYLGPVTRSFQQYTATSGTSSSAVQFNITTPSRKVVVRKNLLIYYSCYTELTATPFGRDGGPYTIFNVANGDAPRCFPVAQNVTSFSASIGNASVQIQNSGQYIEAMSRYFMSIQERNKNMGTFPSYPDPLGAGSNTIGPLGGQPGTYAAFTGTAKDPFTVGDQGRDHRGDYAFYLSPANFANNNAGNIQRASFTSVEPLIGLSMFGQTSTSLSAGFANVENMSLQIALQNPLNWWSHDITKLVDPITFANLITAVSHGFNAAPVCLVEYWSPPESMIPLTPLYYPFSAVTQYPQNAISCASGITFDVNFNNIQVSSVPNALILFCKVAPGFPVSNRAGEVGGSIYAMDNYAGAPTIAYNSTSFPTPSLGTVQITFDNSPAQLAGMTVQQLYNMNVGNGLENTSFAEWSENGAVYKIIPGKDIFMTSPDLVAGSTGSYNLSIQAKFQNNFSVTTSFVPYLILIQDGHLCIGSTTNSLDVGSITAQKLKMGGPIIGEQTTKGAGLFGTLAGTVSSIIPYVSDYSGVARRVGNVVDKLAGTEWKGDGGALYMNPAKRLREMDDVGGYSLH